MPVWKNPTPDWMKPENASVLDSVGTRLARKLANLLGANDPNSMIPAPGIMAAGRAVGGVLPTIRRVLGDQADEFITNLGDFDLSDDGLRVIDRAVSDLIGRKQGVQAGMFVLVFMTLMPSTRVMFIDLCIVYTPNLLLTPKNFISAFSILPGTVMFMVRSTASRGT